MAERHGELWTESVSSETPGVLHMRGEYIEHDADPKELAEVSRWWSERMVEKARAYGGEIIFVRAIALHYERQFERDDLTLRCYARFTVRR